MVTFKQNVNINSREAMITYLRNHFRYYTMNGWNQSTSYAHNMKIHNLGLDKAIANKLYEIIEVEGAYDCIHEDMAIFADEHEYQWQAGFNGRSGGYLVLYQGELRPSGYKSVCRNCGTKNSTSVFETGNICGVCHKSTRYDYATTHMVNNICHGRSVDQQTNYEDWDIEALRSRTEVVQSFDNLADNIVSTAIDMANRYDVCEETIYVPQKKLVLVEHTV